MAVTDEFKQDVLEVLDAYTAALENQSGPNAAPFMAENELDETVAMPALKYTANPLANSRALPDSYRQVPMVTFFNRIDTLAGNVQVATDDLEALKVTLVTATEDANDAADRANTASEGAEKVDATLIGMTVTITDRNGHAHSQNIGFEIYRTYPSIAAMNADAANVPDGKFVMIATTDKTSEENARLYGKNSAGGFTFLSDLDQAATSAWADWMENYKPIIISDHQTAQADHTTATKDHNTATADHTQATTDHTRAETDHTTATKDHTTATTDHTQATTDHDRADSDHETATEDHTRADSDHATAGTDHSTATTDHTRADSDHTRADSDHTRAEQDHTRAEQDHTRADSDHSTFEDDHRISQEQQSTFEQNEAQRQQDFENAEADRMAAMTVTRCFVDLTTMCLMFVQPASDSTQYQVRNGDLYITVRYEV